MRTQAEGVVAYGLTSMSLMGGMVAITGQGRVRNVLV